MSTTNAVTVRRPPHGQARTSSANTRLSRLAQLSQRRGAEYLQRAQNFVAYYDRPPTELGEREIREFLLYLVNERKTGSLTWSEP